VADNEVTTEVGTSGDADITMRESPARPDAGQDWPEAKTHAEADEQASARGVTFPEGNLSLADKVKILNGEEV
jgi:hypothetical protein